MEYFHKLWIHSRKTALTAIACTVLALCFAPISPAAQFPWSEGDRVHVVVVRGSAKSIESGSVTGLNGDLCRVEWDLCHCETFVPVKQLYRTLRAAQRAGAMLDENDECFHESAQSAGKLGLLYLLLSRRGGE